MCISEYFTGWGEFAIDGVADFLDRSVYESYSFEDLDIM